MGTRLILPSFRRRLSVLSALAALVVLAGACTAPPTPVPTYTPTPTRGPATPTVADPNATVFPTPDLASVFIPREALPDGRLFDEGLYAVLKIEGPYYTVIDCHGVQVDTVTSLNYERSSIGLYTKSEIAYRFGLFHFGTAAVETSVPVGSAPLRSYENGSYQVEKRTDGIRVHLYDADGKPTFTVTRPVVGKSSADALVARIGTDTVVYFQSFDADATTWSTDVVFLAPDGTVASETVWPDSPVHPDGLLGRTHFFGSENRSYGLYDATGKRVLVDVASDSAALTYRNVWSSPVYFSVSDYVLCDGQAYDGELSPLPDDVRSADGGLVAGAMYTVQGIPCRASDFRRGVPDPADPSKSDRIAVGTKDGKLAILTRDGESVYDCGEFVFGAMNRSQVLLFTRDGYRFRILSAETGEVQKEFRSPCTVSLADDYALVHLNVYDSPTARDLGACVVDGEGRIRFSSLKSDAEIAPGDCIVLFRGPYEGIADLNGDWILKCLNWEMSRDQKYDRGAH